MVQDEAGEPHDFLRYVVGRPLMLVFWALILWGTLYAGLFVQTVATAGLSEALRQVQSGRDALGGALNLGLAGTAVLVWTVVLTTAFRVYFRKRRARGHPE